MNTLRRISQHTVKAVAAGALLVAAALPLALASTAGATAGLTTPPAAPTAVVAASGLDTSGVGDATINISWVASASGANNATPALGYNVYQGTATGAESTTPLNGAIPITGTQVNVTLLTDGTPYFFVVKAVNSYGLSVASAEVTNTPAGITSAPAATVVAGNTTAKVTWTAPTKTNGSAILGYNVYVTTIAPNSTTLVDPFVTGLNGASGSWLNANGGMNGSTPPLCGTFAVDTYVPANGNDCTALGAFSAANLITGLTYTVTGLTNGTPYYFVVTAVNGVGESLGALASNVSVTPGIAPLAPTGVTVSVVAGGSNLLLSWGNEPSATSGFNVFMGTTAGGESATPVNAAPIGNNTSGNSYLVTGLNPNTSYFFDVAAVSPQGSSPDSTEVFATTLASVPGAPTGVAVAVNNTALTVSWTPPTVTGGSTILTYIAAAFTAAGATAGTCTNTVATDLPNTCQITGLTNGVAYSVAVKATNVSGNSVASVAVSGTPAVTVPDAPRHLHVAILNGSATLTWTQVTGAATEGGVIAGYNVYQGTTSEGEVLVQSVGAVGTATVPVASSGTYYFEVTAVSNVGVSADSGEAYATSGATFAGAPTGLTGSAWQSSSSVGGTDSQVLLSWTPPVNDGGATVTSNNVYAVINGNVAGALARTCPTNAPCPLGGLISTTGTGLVAVTLDSADALVTGLTGGATYSFAVVPVNAFGASDGQGTDALAPSNFASVVAPNLSGAPTSVTVADSGTNIAVSWTAPLNADGTTAIAYQVFVSAANHATGPGTLLPVCSGTNPPCLVSAVTATSALVSGLTAGSSYVFWITATNDDPSTAVANGIVVSYSAESSASLPIVPVALPATPTATAAAGNGYATVTIGSLLGVLSWTATSTPGGLTCTTTTDTSCNVLGLTNGTSYTFTVTDTTLTGTSAASAATTAVIPVGKPGAPTGVSATSVGTAGLPNTTYNATVSWTKPSFGGLAPTAGAPYIVTLANVSAATTTSFLVASALYADYVTNAADRPALTELVGGATGTTTSTLVAGAVQTVASCTPALVGTVVTNTGTGAVAAGSEVVSCSGTTLTLSAAVTTLGASTLTFTGGGADALATAELLANTTLATSGSYTSALVGLGLGGFCVVPAAFLANGTDSSATTNLAISDSTTCTIIGISATAPVASPTIVFVVSAQNASGLTTSTPSLPLLLSKAGTVPGAPTGVAAAASSGLVTLTWTVPATGGSAILGYNVFVGTTAGGESTTPVNGSLLVTGTTVTIPGLTNGTKYYFIVKAVNANGTSVASSEKHAIPVANPGAPTSVTAAAGGANTVVLSWIAPVSTGGVPVIGYLVYVGTPATSTSASIYAATPVNATLITGTSYTVTGLNSGQAYVFLIVASNGVAFSAPSGEVSAKAGTGVVIVPTVTGVYYVPTFSSNASVVITGTGFSAGMTVASSNKDYTVTLEGLNAAGTTATLLVTTTSNATSGTSSTVTFTNLDGGSVGFSLNGGPVPTPVVVGLKISGVSGTILTGTTSTFTITGTGFYGRPTITSNAAGTTAVVTHDTGKTLTVRVTVKAGTKRGVHTFTITLANGTSVQLRYSQH